MILNNLVTPAPRSGLQGDRGHMPLNVPPRGKEQNRVLPPPNDAGKFSEKSPFWPKSELKILFSLNFLKTASSVPLQKYNVNSH